MIRIIATFNLEPASIDKAIEYAKELVSETRKENGCIQYDLIQADEIPTKLVVLENWETREALDAHSNSEHFLRLVPLISGLCYKAPDIEKYHSLI
ncbi:MAG: putative quinol monooxygenase [Suipraeoptans sp.]